MRRGTHTKKKVFYFWNNMEPLNEVCEFESQCELRRSATPVASRSTPSPLYAHVGELPPTPMRHAAGAYGGGTTTANGASFMMSGSFVQFPTNTPPRDDRTTRPFTSVESELVVMHGMSQQQRPSFPVQSTSPVHTDRTLPPSSTLWNSTTPVERRRDDRSCTPHHPSSFLQSPLLSQQSLSHHPGTPFRRTAQSLNSSTTIFPAAGQSPSHPQVVSSAAGHMSYTHNPYSPNRSRTPVQSPMVRLQARSPADVATAQQSRVQSESIPQTVAHMMTSPGRDFLLLEGFESRNLSPLSPVSEGDDEDLHQLPTTLTLGLDDALEYEGVEVPKLRLIVEPVWEGGEDDLSELPKDASPNDPRRRLRQRRKQISHGKDSDGYIGYCRFVPKEKRQVGHPHHPITPRVLYNCSKRAFDKILKQWRKALHHWDRWGAKDVELSQLPPLLEAFQPMPHLLTVPQFLAHQQAQLQQAQQSQALHSVPMQSQTGGTPPFMPPPPLPNRSTNGRPVASSSSSSKPPVSRRPPLPAPTSGVAVVVGTHSHNGAPMQSPPSYGGTVDHSSLLFGPPGLPSYSPQQMPTCCPQHHLQVRAGPQKGVAPPPQYSSGRNYYH